MALVCGSATTWPLPLKSGDVDLLTLLREEMAKIPAYGPSVWPPDSMVHPMESADGWRYVTSIECTDDRIDRLRERSIRAYGRRRR
jgi:hypothetical protein